MLIARDLDTTQAKFGFFTEFRESVWDLKLGAADAADGR